MCAGHPRAGTSFVFSILRQMPDIRTSPVKEWHFWDRIIVAGREWQNLELKGLPATRVADSNIKPPVFPSFRYQKALKEFWRLSHSWDIQSQPDSALDQFVSLMSCFDVGDFSPSNSLLTQSQWTELKHRIPNLKVIMTVRNPVRQLWSAFCNRQFKHGGIVGRPELEEYLANSSLAVRKLKAADTLSRLRGAGFCERDILVVKFDEIAAKPSEVILSIGQFLNSRPAVVTRKSFDRFLKAKSKSKPLPEEWEELLLEKTADIWRQNIDTFEYEFKL